MPKEIDLRNLQDELSGICNELNHLYWKANNYFYIRRPSYSFLKKYLNKRNNVWVLRITSILSFPIKFLFWYLTNTIYLFMKPGVKPLFVDKNKKNLFISHATRGNPNFQVGDRIFHGFPEYLNSNSIIYFLNHSNESYPTIKQRITKSIKQDYYLNSKNLTILKMLKVINMNSYLVAQVYFKEFLKLLFNCSNFYLLTIIENQIKRSTLANIVVALNIDEIIELYGIRNIVMTFEGHAYENLIYNLSVFGNFNRKLFMYQHAPTSKIQLSMVNYLSNSDSNVSTLFSSEYSANYFRKLIPEKKNHFYIIGSNKFIKPVKGQLKGNNILMAPEGENSVFYSFLLLAEEILNLRNEKIVIRIHPDLRLNLINKNKIRRLIITKSVRISNDQLSKDLNEAKLCVFRASSVGLEALYRGVPSVFYGSRWENEWVNPLSKVIKNNSYVNLSRLDFFKSDLAKSIKPIKYYQPLNVRELRILLR